MSEEQKEFAWRILPHQKNIWVGTYNGLKKYTIDGNLIKHYFHAEDNSHSLGHNWVLSIYKDSDNMLWVGTHGGGLNLFDPAIDGFRKFTTHEGLSGNIVYDILEDQEDNLWLSTSKGICKFNKTEYTVSAYGITDGLEAEQFNPNTASMDENGHMYFGSNNGLIYFNPAHISNNDFIPPIFITDFKVFNESLDITTDGALKKNIIYADTVVLSYKQSVFSLEFSALNYCFPEENEYAYYLEGFDKTWTEAGHKRTATYTNLNPGTYHFHVKGSNNDGVWNE
ncbi:MAG: hypothetical protein GVY19_00720 [Bacteroidetes bacterium]|nr:hypothetical protein [Bacteroidota bacterium]